MKELQLTEILKSFSYVELNSFRKCLSSTFNKSVRNPDYFLKNKF